jgi:hypothetical protein
MMKSAKRFWMGSAAAVALCCSAALSRPCGAGQAGVVPSGPLFPDAVTDVAPREIGWMAPGDNLGLPPNASADPAGHSSAPPDYPRVLPPNAAAPDLDPLHESTWYGRVDYFDWQERLAGTEFVRETGALPVLGYQHRFGRERIRAELFGGTVDYGGAIDFGAVQEWVPSVTRYLGARGEYDLLIEPEGWPVRFLVGVGARLWSRDMPDATSPLGNAVLGYTEMWLSLYPYAGVETRLRRDGGAEWYGSLRGGVTAINYERVTDFNLVLYPKVGAFAETEFGIRGGHLGVAGFLQMMTWNESNPVRDSLQPYSRMFLAGLKAGWSF